MMTDVIVGLLGFLFTLMILSYLVGDTPFFRLAIHIFVGVAAGYVTLITWQQVIINKVAVPLLYGDWIQRVVLFVPVVMGLFLLTRVFPKYQSLGRWVVAFLAGVGAAAVVAGAFSGTLWPQLGASIDLFEFAPASTPQQVAEKATEGILILLGTITSLAYFQFSIRQNAVKPGRRGLLMRVITFIGEIFIAITFGALFAGVLSSALAAMVNRIQSILDFFASILF